MTNPILTVVMPAYNEEDAIADAVADIRRDVLDVIPNSEIIVVNDGSKDRTGQILDELAAADPRVRAVHRVNGGHGAAIVTGLDAATGKYVFLIDSDRQIPLTSFKSLWDAVQSGSDAAFGVRRERHDPKIRIFLTGVIRQALRLLFGVVLYDANVPYKLLRREDWLRAKPLIPEGTLAPSLFLAVWAKKNGLRISEIEVPHAERSTGEVSIKRWKLFRFCSIALGQLLEFRRRLAT
jgi:glycosyltransferase involved in cell wall biosynthesis